MKKAILSVLFFVNFFIYAQEGLPIYSDYLTDNYYLIHPSMAGAANCAKIRLTGRTQWAGVDNAPSLQTLSFNQRLGGDLGSSGVGAIMFNDGNGYHSQTGGYLTYAHHLMLSRNSIDLNMLSFGLSGGFLQSRLDQTSWDTTGEDPNIVNGLDNSVTYFNVDFGFSYQFLEFYLHGTIKNLLGSGRDLYSPQYESTNIKRYLGSFGYVHAVNPKLSIEPSIMYQMVDATKESSIDLNLKVYKKTSLGRVWGGFSWRKSFDGAEYADGQTVGIQKLNLITPFIGTNYKKFMFAYTYSSQSGEVKFANGGYHQVTIGYNFNCFSPKYECNCPAIN